MLSLRINQIVAHESGIAATTDPLGGAYYVEDLTDRIHAVIMDQVEKIDQMGGALGAVRSGYYAESLAEGAYREQRELDRGDRTVVGVNAYVQEEKVDYPRFRVDEAGEARQVSRLRDVKARRDSARVRDALEGVGDACRGDENVVPSVVEAVRLGATVGEICQVWREQFGVHTELRQRLS